VNPNETGGRHRRRRDTSVVRAALDEARQAGLVQRHLRKLHYLATRPPSGESAPPTAAGAAPPATGPPLPEPWRAGRVPEPGGAEARVIPPEAA
jgi:hypothetical protein